MRTADISTNFHQCCAAETLCSAAISPQLTVYVLDNSCTRTTCSCTGVQIVSDPNTGTTTGTVYTMARIATQSVVPMREELVTVREDAGQVK